jgi:hypothetical protein
VLPRVTSLPDHLPKPVNESDPGAPVVVEGRLRTATYLTANPNSAEGVAYMDVGNAAVCLFDWDVEMVAIPP